MNARLPDASLDALFSQARTHNVWRDATVDDGVLRELYRLVALGPTSANCSPARLLFIRSAEGRERLRPALSKGNLAKTMTAPVNVVVAYDRTFFEELPRLFPHTDARSWFVSSRSLAEETALRNGSMQGAYLILAARSLGLDVGVLSGFDRAKVDAEFFAGTSWTANFIVNLGYGDPSALHPRLPRLGFDEACRLA